MTAVLTAGCARGLLPVLMGASLGREQGQRLPHGTVTPAPPCSAVPRADGVSDQRSEVLSKDSAGSRQVAGPVLLFILHRSRGARLRPSGMTTGTRSSRHGEAANTMTVTARGHSLWERRANGGRGGRGGPGCPALLLLLPRGLLQGVSELPARKLGVAAQFLFNPEELVVLGQALGAAGSASLDLEEKSHQVTKGVGAFLASGAGRGGQRAVLGHPPARCRAPPPGQR